MLSVCRFEADYVLSSPHLKDIFRPIWSGPFKEVVTPLRRPTDPDDFQAAGERIRALTEGVGE